MKVFLSSSAHRDFSHELIHALEMRGFQVWTGFNEEIERLDGYWERVKLVNERADVILALMTSRGDYHVESEISKANGTAQVAIVSPEPISDTAREDLKTITPNLFLLADWHRNQHSNEFERLVSWLAQQATSIDLVHHTLSSRQVETSLFLASVQTAIERFIFELEGAKPNSEDELVAWKAEVFSLSELREMIEKIRSLVPEVGSEASEDAVSETKRTLSTIASHLRKWPLENGVELVDGIWRTALIGSIAGVGLAFGQPLIGAGIGIAVFGGDRVGKGIAAAIKQGGKDES